jgi:hypothetical protein
MKTVHKYKVLPGSYSMMPKDAEVLSVGQQGGDIVCWALVDDRLPADCKRGIFGAGTGHSLPETPGDFIGTVQMDTGLVFHFFDAGYADDTVAK